MKITKKRLQRIIKEEKAKLMAEMHPAAPGQGAQADQNLKDYQDGFHGGAHVGVEEKLEDAAYAMVDMFIELNGVDRHEARQMVIEYLTDFLGRHG